MADVAAADDANLEEGAEKPAKKGKLKKLLLLVLLPLFVLLASLGAAWKFGLFTPSSQKNAAGEVVKEMAFYNVPSMTVNLSSTEQRAHYLKIEIALEMQNKSIAENINPVLPRVMDAFQTYLRELRTSDLEGSAAIYRLKEELLRRVNDAIYPAQVDRVLFKEILVQ